MARSSDSNKLIGVTVEATTKFSEKMELKIMWEGMVSPPMKVFERPSVAIRKATPF